MLTVSLVFNVLEISHHLIRLNLHLKQMHNLQQQIPHPNLQFPLPHISLDIERLNIRRDLNISHII
jgi:hypothetical protein